MIKRIIIISIIIALLYRLYKRFISPILKIANATRQQMNEMKNKMDNLQKEHNNFKANQSKAKEIEGDYIDYEEVKP